ncbi:MAG: hypothetical protein FD145_83 [Candidatus Saganbacteria bacterium]|uniref:Uncharacterized protein n=1 Tax=Candidatus Saganbacteria bacterium TaxID=2575572 RepID=A0A833L526_UNCSA|nr:MAG: hypothetical protein FD145_83 [Candidatus Saganbacteria bacterium]
MDWTDLYDQKTMVEYANKLADDVILEIYNKKLSIYKTLSSKELLLLLRFPINSVTYMFIERLLRVSFQIETKSGVAYPKIDYELHYFNNTREVVLSYYHDYAINHAILHKIQCIFNHNEFLHMQTIKNLPKPQESLLKREDGFNLKKQARKILASINSFYVKLIKPKVIGEYSGWMKSTLSSRDLFHFDFLGSAREINYDIRSQIKGCYENIFFKYANKFVGAMDEIQAKKVSKAYAEFMDCALPLSIVEGFEEKYAYYKSRLNQWDIKQVHSFTGYSLNENFKIFAFLAKRKGALLVCHDHGVVNYQPFFAHADNELRFIDYFFTWGKANSDWIKSKRPHVNVKIINYGTPFLYYLLSSLKLKKWRGRDNNSEDIVVLYPAQPLTEFMRDLDSLSPEKFYQHRLNMLCLLKEIKTLYHNLKILYKPFPGTDSCYDPIQNDLVKSCNDGSIKVLDINVLPMSLYDKVDFVLWDSISTGFAESIQTGVPTLVFQSKYEFNCISSDEGKKINRELVKCGMVFYDVKSGINSFNRVVNDLPGFIEDRKEPIKRFKEALAYPVAKKDFLQQMEAALSNG